MFFLRYILLKIRVRTYKHILLQIECIIKTYICMHTYARVSGVKALPVFGRSVNPILTRGGGGGQIMPAKFLHIGPTHFWTFFRHLWCRHVGRGGAAAPPWYGAPHSWIVRGIPYNKFGIIRVLQMSPFLLFLTANRL